MWGLAHSAKGDRLATLPYGSRSIGPFRDRLMLLTLATRSFFSTLSTGSSNEPRTVLDLPAFASRELKLRGLNISTSMLGGWSFEDLDVLRDLADKSACPCLVLIEDKPMILTTEKGEESESAAARMQMLATAANRLGCNALAISIQANDDPDSFDLTTQTVRNLIPTIERHELNLLLTPYQGLMSEPDRMIEVIKRIGGFRIGALPSFAHAASTSDPIETLRKLAPYAGAIHASVPGFTNGDTCGGINLPACVHAIRSVGFLNTLAIDYLGEDDPVENIEKARTILQAAIEAEME